MLPQEEKHWYPNDLSNFHPKLSMQCKINYINSGHKLSDIRSLLYFYDIRYSSAQYRCYFFSEGC